MPPKTKTIKVKKTTSSKASESPKVPKASKALQKLNKNKYFENVLIDNKDKNILTFELINVNNNLHISLANAIRRTIISEIPIYTIDDTPDKIHFEKNTSVIHEENIAHRLSFIPLNYFNIKNIDDKKKLQDFTFHVKAKNETDSTITVYTNEMVPSEGKIEDFLNIEIPIIQLNPFQEIDITCRVAYDIQHNAGASFSPTCCCIYTFKEDPITFQEHMKTIDKSSFDNELDVKNYEIENKERFYLKNAETNEPSIYSYKIESVGQLPPSNIVAFVFPILSMKLETFVKGLINNDMNIISVHTGDSVMECFDFHLPNEDHTIGNLFTEYLVNRSDVKFAGYKISHPLKKILIIRLGLKNNSTQQECIKVFLENIANIRLLIADIETNWNNL